MGLYDMVLIKDNHIAAAGGIPQAVEAAKAYLQQNGMDIGVEVGWGSSTRIRLKIHLYFGTFVFLYFVLLYFCTFVLSYFCTSVLLYFCTFGVGASCAVVGSHDVWIYISLIGFRNQVLEFGVFGFCYVGGDEDFG